MKNLYFFILKLGFYLNLMLSKLGKMSEKPFPEYCIVFFSSAHSTKEVGFVATRYDGTQRPQKKDIELECQR